MLVNEREVLARLNSPTNLVSQINRGFERSPKKDAMNLFIPNNTKESFITKLLESKEVKRSEEEIKAEVKIEAKEEVKTIMVNPFSKPQAPSIFSPPENSVENLAEISSEESSKLEELLNDSEAEIKLALAHNSAVNLVEKAISALSGKVDNMKSSDLTKVISVGSKLVEGIRKERLELRKQDKEREVHFHFYTPQQKNINDYKIIEVDSTPALG